MPHYQKLGHGSIAQVDAPMRVSSLERVTKIACGGVSSVAITSGIMIIICIH